MKTRLEYLPPFLVPRRARRAGLAVAVACLAGALEGAGSPAAGPACGTAPGAEAAGWTAPSPLPAVPAGFTLRWPSLAAGRGRLWVAGNLFPVASGDPLPALPLAVLRLPGGPVPPPPGDFRFAYPRVGIDPVGRVHLAWLDGGARPATAREWTRTRFTALWHAVYDGQGWSVPERVLSAPGVSWGDEGRALAIDAAGRIHLAAIVSGRGTGPSALYLRRTGTGWSRRRLPVMPGYLSVAVSPRGPVALAYTAADTRVRADGSSVFAMVSTDAGEHWDPPVLVSRSGNRAATLLQALYDPGGALHLVWGQNLSGGAQAEALRHRVSEDGAAAWRELQDAPLPAATLRFQAVADRCGAVRAVVEGLDGGRPVLREVWWRGSGAGARPLFGELAAAANAGVAQDGDAAWLVWSAVRRPGDDAVQLFASSRMAGP